MRGAGTPLLILDALLHHFHPVHRHVELLLQDLEPQVCDFLLGQAQLLILSCQQLLLVFTLLLYGEKKMQE